MREISTGLMYFVYALLRVFPLSFTDKVTWNSEFLYTVEWNALEHTMSSASHTLKAVIMFIFKLLIATIYNPCSLDLSLFIDSTATFNSIRYIIH